MEALIDKRQLLTSECFCVDGFSGRVTSQVSVGFLCQLAMASLPLLLQKLASAAPLSCRTAASREEQHCSTEQTLIHKSALQLDWWLLQALVDWYLVARVACNLQQDQWDTAASDFESRSVSSVRL